LAINGLCGWAREIPLCGIFRAQDRQVKTLMEMTLWPQAIPASGVRIVPSRGLDRAQLELNNKNKSN
jgi:hypothetical protein